jgi:hypothetical protein
MAPKNAEESEGEKLEKKSCKLAGRCALDFCRLGADWRANSAASEHGL